MITILIFISDCELVTPPENNNSTFAIYFLKDTTLTFWGAVNKNLTLDDLADTPWLTQNDIEFYDWSSHCIYLKKNKEYLFPVPFTPNYEISVWENKILVVVANGEICYKISGRSGVPPLPQMTFVEIIIRYPNDVLNIDWPYPFANDERDNNKVKKALIESGLLHEGLQVTLDKVNIIENRDTSTIEYTFTLTNNDRDNLYVFDPDKTGSGIFHFYTNGPDLLNAKTRKLYPSTFKQVIETDNWSPDWFTKLGTGESIERTVLLKGYPYFAAGEYAIIFDYSGPTKIPLKDRILSDGRYWIGGARSNYSFIYVE
jgi:hypothetical protein